MTANPNSHQPSNESEPYKRRAGRLSARLLIEKLTNRGPSIESRIDATTGPFIEVGAVPSSVRTDSIINLHRIGKQLLTSNFEVPQAQETGYRHRITGNMQYISHRDDVPSSRLYRLVASQPKVVEGDENWGTPITDRIDFRADATELPLRNGGVGALYAIGLNDDAEARLLSDETPRTLEPGGVIVLDGVNKTLLDTENPYLMTIKMRPTNDERVNYAAVRNDVPYQPPHPGKL